MGHYASQCPEKKKDKERTTTEGFAMMCEAIADDSDEEQDGETILFLMCGDS